LTIKDLEEAYAAFEAEEYDRAGDLLAAAAAAAAPESAGPLWFDAALCALRERNWPAARDRGLEAIRFVERGAYEPAYWNLGTAATALRDWELARDCWVGFGMKPLPGTGPIDIPGGPTCVRLDIGEVVWAVRIDPVRARVVNVPFDPSRRYGEIVLHSGAPTGERVFGGNPYPVFDELELFEPSDLATLAVVVTAQNADDTEDLADRFARAGYGMEILKSRVDRCSCCSQGSTPATEAVSTANRTCSWPPRKTWPGHCSTAGPTTARTPAPGRTCTRPDSFGRRSLVDDHHGSGRPGLPYGEGCEPASA
jgi:hypothetical protein